MKNNIRICFFIKIYFFFLEERIGRRRTFRWKSLRLGTWFWFCGNTDIQNMSLSSVRWIWLKEFVAQLYGRQKKNKEYVNIGKVCNVNNFFHLDCGWKIERWLLSLLLLVTLQKFMIFLLYNVGTMYLALTLIF